MTLNGIRFYDPREEDLTDRDYGISKEDGRQSVRFLWLENREENPKDGSISLQSYLLECSSRGTMTLDGCRLTDKEDLRKAGELFKMGLFS